MKFTEQGHIKLSARVELSVDRSSTVRAVIQVEDSGIGIPDEDRESIFRAFEQQEGQSHAKYGGAGLGLSISKRLVELMRGTLSVTSEVGVGSTFNVVLEDVHVASISEVSSSKSNDRDASTLRFEPATLLVVDDIALNRNLLVNFLEPAGFAFVEAADGQQAIAQARQHEPDLILMDIRMPVINGYEATQIIKTDEALAHIPVVAVTASAMKDFEAQVKTICDGYLKKPVSRADLLLELAKFLPHSRLDGGPPMREAGGSGLDLASAGPWLPNADSVESISRLVVLLETELTPRAEVLGRTMPVDEIEGFATRCLELGTTHDCPPLITWARRLADGVSLLDMEVIPDTLGEFPKLVSQISQSVK